MKNRNIIPKISAVPVAQQLQKISYSSYVLENKG